jgi:Conserved TM helix
MPEQMTTWGVAIQNSLTNALSLLLATIPAIIGALIILAIGWFVASVVARAVAAILRRVRFNDMAHRSGLAEFVNNTGLETDAIGFVALTAKWFVRLIALVVAFDALGLPAVSDTLRQFVLWLPSLVVALVVLVIGGLAANGVYGLVRASATNADFGNPDALASVARVAVWAFAIVVAVHQVGIASELVTTLFTAIVAGLALAVGLAFGLGGRDTAREIVHDIYDRLRPGSPRMQSSPRERISDQRGERSRH